MTVLFFLDNNQVSAKIPDGKIVYLSRSKHHACVSDYTINFPQNKGVYDPYWLQKWAGKKKISDAKTMRQLLIRNGTSLWYNIEWFVFGHVKEIPFWSSGLLCYYVDAVQEILKKEKPTKIFVQNKEEAFYQIVLQVAKKKKIPVQNLGIKYRKPLSAVLKDNPSVIALAFWVRMLFRWCIGLFSQKHRADILLLSNERFLRGSAEKNAFWGPLARELTQREVSFTFLEIDAPWKFSNLFTMLRRQLRNVPKTMYIGAFYSFTVLKETWQTSSFMKRQWRKAKSSRRFTSSMIYKGIDLTPLLSQRMDFVFRAFSCWVAEAHALSSKITSDLAPKVVVMDHENNFYGLPFLSLARSKKFKTVALQFETVNQRSCRHRYYEDKMILNRKHSEWRPLPDKKCASGPFAKEILIEQCNYPPDRITLTGEPRFDKLTQKIRTRSEQSLARKELSLPERPIIVYATKFLMEEKPIWDELARVTEKIGGELIFKLAPVNNPEEYADVLPPGKHIRAVKDADLMRLLTAADVFVTTRSTISFEAMGVGVPVLIVDLDRTVPYPFESLRATAYASAISEIGSQLNSCLLSPKKFQAGASSFLKQYLWKLDGRAAERVADVLLSLMKPVGGRSIAGKTGRPLRRLAR